MMSDTLIEEPALLRMRLGTALRERRKELHLTLQQLAARTALTVPMLSRYEKGKNYPSAESLQHLAEALGIPPVFLTDLSAPERTLFLTLRSLSPDGVKAVVNYARSRMEREQSWSTVRRGLRRGTGG